MFRAIIIALLLTSASASAQQRDHVYAYATFNATHVDVVPSGDSTVPITSQGIGLGVTANVLRPPGHALEIGLDLRIAYVPEFTNGSDGSTYAGRTNLFLAGTTLTFHPRKTHLRPYALISFGGIWANGFQASTARYSTNTLTTERRMFEYTGGVDYQLTQHVGLRLAEIGFGGATKYPSDGTPSSLVVTVNSGLVLRF